MPKSRMVVNRVYAPLFQSQDCGVPWRTALLRGPRYAGRTYAAGQYMVTKMRQRGGLYYFVREFQNSIAESNFRVVKHMVEQDPVLDDEFEVRSHTVHHRQTGAEAHFLGLRHQAASLMSAYGIACIHAEQAEKLQREDINMLMPTLREAGAQIIYTYNPTNANDAIEEDYWNPDVEALRIQSSHEDNAFLDKAQFRAEASRLWATSPLDYNWAILGEYRRTVDNSPFAPGTVEAAFTADAGDRNMNLYTYAGIDLAFSDAAPGKDVDATAIVILDESGREVYAAEYRIANHADLMARLEADLRKHEVQYAYVDITGGHAVAVEDLGGRGCPVRGYVLNRGNKTQMIREVARRLSEGGLTLHSDVLQSQLLSFAEDTDTGKLEAAPGHHDDSVIALGLAVEVLRRAGI